MMAIESLTVRREPRGLVALEEARHAIEVAREERDADSLKSWREAADRWVYHYRRRRGGKEAADTAGEIKVWAEHALALLDIEANPHGGDRRSSSEGSELALDLDKDTRAQIRKLAGLTVKALERLIKVARQDELRGVTTAHILALQSGDLGGLKSSVTTEWYTPSRYVEAAREVMGGIDLDPASCALANETVRAESFFDERDNGLDREWHGRVWLNPPYGTASGKFTVKLLAEHQAGRVTAAVLLLNGYGFDSAWFQPLWAFPICFTDHRIQFWSPERGSGGPANANVFVYVGREAVLFAKVFSVFGHVVREWP